MSGIPVWSPDVAETQQSNIELNNYQNPPTPGGPGIVNSLVNTAARVIGAPDVPVEHFPNTAGGTFNAALQQGLASSFEASSVRWINKQAMAASDSNFMSPDAWKDSSYYRPGLDATKLTNMMGQIPESTADLSASEYDQDQSRAEALSNSSHTGMKYLGGFLSNLIDPANLYFAGRAASIASEFAPKIIAAMTDNAIAKTALRTVAGGIEGAAAMAPGVAVNYASNNALGQQQSPLEALASLGWGIGIGGGLRGVFGYRPIITPEAAQTARGASVDQFMNGKAPIVDPIIDQGYADARASELDKAQSAIDEQEQLRQQVAAQNAPIAGRALGLEGPIDVNTAPQERATTGQSTDFGGQQFVNLPSDLQKRLGGFTPRLPGDENTISQLSDTTSKINDYQEMQNHPVFDQLGNKLSDINSQITDQEGVVNKILSTAQKGIAKQRQTYLKGSLQNQVNLVQEYKSIPGLWPENFRTAAFEEKPLIKRHQAEVDKLQNLYDQRSDILSQASDKQSELLNPLYTQRENLEAILEHRNQLTDLFGRPPTPPTQDDLNTTAQKVASPENGLGYIEPLQQQLGAELENAPKTEEEAFSNIKDNIENLRDSNNEADQAAVSTSDLADQHFNIVAAALRAHANCLQG